MVLDKNISATIHLRDTDNISVMHVHENWAQNRQATAVCDFCNRKNIPLQKCEDCNINICKRCISKGTLASDSRHMLANDDADNFDWHQWGNTKDTKRESSVRRTRSNTRVNALIPEPSHRTVSSQPLGGYSGHLTPNGNIQYSPAPYHNPMGMIDQQQYHHAPQGLRTVGYYPTLGQYPQITRYPYSPPPYDMYGNPAGQPIYNHCLPQQSPCGLYSPQVPQSFSTLPGPANTVGPTARGQSPQSFIEPVIQPEDAQRLRQTPNGKSPSQAFQAPPPTPVLTPKSVNTTQNGTPLIPEQYSARTEDVQSPVHTSNEKQVTQVPHDAPKQAVVASNKIQKSRQAPELRRQVVRGSKRPREKSEGPGKRHNKGVSSPERLPAKRPRRENASLATERRPNSTFTAQASKRVSQTIEDDDENDAEKQPAEKLRHDHTPQTKVVKLRVQSACGVQRLREILGTPEAGSTNDSKIQYSLPRLSSSSLISQTGVSGRNLKKTRLDEPFETASAQPAPDLSTRTHQFSAITDQKHAQTSSVIRPIHRPHPGNQVEDIEAQEAAMILLSMRHGR